MLEHRPFEARAEDIEVAGYKLFISSDLLHPHHELKMLLGGRQWDHIGQPFEVSERKI